LAALINEATNFVVGSKSKTTAQSVFLVPVAQAIFSHTTVRSFVPVCCIVAFGVLGKLRLHSRAVDWSMLNDDFIQNNCRSGIHYSYFCRKQ